MHEKWCITLWWRNSHLSHARSPSRCTCSACGRTTGWWRRFRSRSSPITSSREDGQVRTGGAMFRREQGCRFGFGLSIPRGLLPNYSYALAISPSQSSHWDLAQPESTNISKPKRQPSKGVIFSTLCGNKRWQRWNGDGAQGGLMRRRLSTRSGLGTHLMTSRCERKNNNLVGGQRSDVWSLLLVPYNERMALGESLCHELFPNSLLSNCQ